MGEQKMTSTREGAQVIYPYICPSINDATCYEVLISPSCISGREEESGVKAEKRHNSFIR
jgi:hypothetical protein